jgi:uncharacterized RDD family membrane protein YckC
MSAIVTGEAVVLELRPASFAARSLGCAIDVLATVVLGVGLLLGVSAVPDLLDADAAKVFGLVAIVALLVAIPVAVETLTRGRSLGKWAMGLRIVRDDGGSIRFRQALIRGLLGFFEIYMMLGSVAFLVSIFNDRSKRLGDMLAGTYSMRVRAPKTPPLMVTTPPQLRGWAEVADIGRLPDPLARRISQFLRQSRQMAPASRQGLGAALATEASAFVAPLPPYGTAPEAFLSALTSERRDREFRRLTASQARAAALAGRLQAHGSRPD